MTLCDSTYSRKENIDDAHHTLADDIHDSPRSHRDETCLHKQTRYPPSTSYAFKHPERFQTGRLMACTLWNRLGTCHWGQTYGRVQLRNCPLEAVESLIELHLRRYLQDPSVQASVEGPVKKWTAPIASQHPFRIQPGYILAVQLMGGLPDQPREWKAKVDENGRIALGPIYGRVAVSGLTLDEAEVAVTNHLSNVLHSPEVSVTHGGWLLEDDNDQLVSRLERLEGEVQQLKAAMSELQSGSSSAENDNPEN